MCTVNVLDQVLVFFKWDEIRIINKSVVKQWMCMKAWRAERSPVNRTAGRHHRSLSGSTHLSLAEVKPCDPCTTLTEGGDAGAEPASLARLSAAPARCVQAACLCTCSLTDSALIRPGAPGGNAPLPLPSCHLRLCARMHTLAHSRRCCSVRGR